MRYSIKPEVHELREARQTVKKVLESCQYVLEKEDDLSLNLGSASKDKVEDFGVFGAAESSDTAAIYFNAEIEGWKDNLEDLTADVYGQAWFYENSEVNFKWQQILASITGLMVIEEISKPREIEIEDFKEEWTEKKAKMSEKASGGDIENLSWQLKTAIGRKLLEKYNLKEFDRLKRSDVLEAGDALFE